MDKKHIDSVMGAPIRTYTAFVVRVKEYGLTLSQVRYDEPPTEAVDALAEDCGNLYRYERYVARYEREQSK